MGPRLIISLLASCACYLVAYRWSGAEVLGPLRNLVATLAASLPLLFAMFTVERRGEGGTDRRWLFVLLAGVVLLRLCPPWDALIGSDDTFRYLWDGRVQAHGINPFAHAPDAPELAHLQESRFQPNIYRPDMRTVYPGLAQIWFLAAYALHPTGFIGWKLILLLHELAAAWLLFALLRERGLPPLRALGYAWSPLPVVQLFGGGHLDGLMVPWLLLAVWMYRHHRPGWAAACLGAAAQVRPVALFAVPPLLLGRGLTFKHRTAGGLAFTAAFVLFLLPYAGAGRLLVESLLVYASRWRFNGSIFQLMELALGRRAWVRRAAYGVVAATSIGSSWLPMELHGRMAVALAGYFVMAPTVYPWYLLGILALISLYGGPLPMALPSLITLSDLVFWVKAMGGKWRLPPALLLLEYLGILALLCWQFSPCVRRKSGPNPRTNTASCPTEKYHADGEWDR